MSNSQNGIGSSNNMQNYLAINDAINRVQAVIEFDLEGKILHANQNFLYALGYTLDEVVGQHHRIFCDSDYVLTAEYRKFWSKLATGEFEAGEYKRISKSGKEVWIQASYNPVFDEQGNPVKVVKFATEITQQKLRNAEFESIMNAINKSQAVIEFSLDGKILNANENFLNVMGYKLAEVKGCHHSIFCDPAYVESQEYKDFWRTLAAGEFHSGEFHRFGKGQKDVWIQASYNPVFDSNGKPIKIIKFAADVTASRQQFNEYKGMLDAIGRSQAVIEFKLDGTILNANQNFLDTLGYTLDEIVGKHHRIFCEPEYVKTAAYRELWENLNRGEYASGAYRRVTKAGQNVWIQASYNPIFDLNGKLLKVVKYASDITEAKNRAVESEGRIKSISKSQAVIEFDLNGIVTFVNPNFLEAMGYKKEEVLGQHHRIFCPKDYADSIEYTLFWEKLRRGQFDSGEYLRVSKDGQPVWIMATYNPILDVDGNITRVVKYATVVTEQKEREKVLQHTAKEVKESIAMLTDSINEIATSAQAASKLANETQSMAKSGDAILRQSLQSSEKIKESANSVAAIVEVISEIADQTNLLAFNAAIEAARAGEQGRGFSVVADEVRKLAEKSAEAAKQIGQLIRSTVEIVNSGNEISKSAGKSFEEIAAGISNTNMSMAHISEASQDQIQFALQIEDAIRKIVFDESEAADIAGSPRSVTKNAS